MEALLAWHNTSPRITWRTNEICLTILVSRRRRLWVSCRPNVDSAFTLSGMVLPHMISNPSHDLAKLVSSWLNDGLFDALNRGYVRVAIFQHELTGVQLKDAVLSVHSMPNETARTGKLLESYTVRQERVFCSGLFNGVQQFSVSDDTKQLHIRTSSPGSKKRSNLDLAAIRSSSVSLVRSLTALMGTLEPLPTKRYLSMKVRAWRKSRLWSDTEPVPVCSSHFTTMSVASHAVQCR